MYIYLIASLSPTNTLSYSHAHTRIHRSTALAQTNAATFLPAAMACALAHAMPLRIHNNFAINANLLQFMQMRLNAHCCCCRFVVVVVLLYYYSCDHITPAKAAADAADAAAKRTAIFDDYTAWLLCL